VTLTTGTGASGEILFTFPIKLQAYERMTLFLERITPQQLFLRIPPGDLTKKEYEIRKDENIRFAEKYGVPIVDAEYDTDNWYARAKGMEFEPERGSRCAMCFDMRMERTALYAHENGFDTIATSLGISRWKDLNQVNEAGKNAASKYEGLTYWDYNWRKNGGSACNMEICKSEKFYQQEYCGCAFSLRDANKWRVENGREKIRIGEKFYGTEK